MDSRLVGQTAENIFLSLLNERDVSATVLDTQGFDGIVFDIDNQYFKFGKSPFYVQIKCRGSKRSVYSPQGHSGAVFEKIRERAASLRISEDSVYFVVGFYKNRDIRDIVFFGIPIQSIHLFESPTQYRFSVERCTEAIHRDTNIFSI